VSPVALEGRKRPRGPTSKRKEKGIPSFELVWSKKRPLGRGGEELVQEKGEKGFDNPVVSEPLHGGEKQG